MRLKEVLFMNRRFELQPLRIVGGWTVEFNNFYECEPDCCGDLGEYLVEDLLQLTYSKSNIIIDLGWYPDGDEKGSYQLVLVKDYNWEKPLEHFDSRSTKEIVDKIEYWSNWSFIQKYI
jgi:hypothetical protein